MRRNLGLLWISACWAALALAPTVTAQDMTGGMVTDPPAPVSGDAATFTATYENLGPGPAANIYVSVLVPIQPQTFPMDSPGFLAMLESTLGTDTNGNEVAYGFDWEDTCNYYILQLWDPNPPDPANPYTIPNPFPAGHSGAFSWEMPMIPMEGTNAGRLVITEPESLRNSYSVNSAQWTDYDWLHGYAGLYNLVAEGADCSALGAGCVDLESCFGHRLWATDPFEADLEIVVGDNVGWPGADPTFGCGSALVGFTAGRIALMRRGACPFLEKFQNAQNAGALGVIIANNGACAAILNFDPDECTIQMGTDPVTAGGAIDIPAVMMSTRQGDELFAAVQGGQTVHAKMGNLPGDHVDVFSWIFSAFDDPDPFNDYLVTRVPLGLFSDGFESGDTTAWSATVP